MPLLEQVAPAIGRLGLVLDDVGKCSFANLAGKICAFRGPVPKRRPETMHRIVRFHSAHGHDQDHVRHRLLVRPAWENELAAGRQHLGKAEKLDAAWRQGYPKGPLLFTARTS